MLESQCTFRACEAEVAYYITMADAYLECVRVYSSSHPACILAAKARLAAADAAYECLNGDTPSPEVETQSFNLKERRHSKSNEPKNTVAK